MRVGKVTKELLRKMITARKSGMTYSQIESEFSVSRWTTLRYLKAVEPGTGPKDDWKEAEVQAQHELEGRGFELLMNLNTVCPSPYWDYCAKKDGEKWLIDVTINKFKSIVDKSHRMVGGYRCAVLYKNETEWELMEIKTSKIKREG